MTVSSQIIEVLDHLATKFGVAIDWTAENVIPYLEQLAGKYINWEIAISVMWIVVGVLFITFGVVMIIVDYKQLDDGMLAVMGVVLIIIALIIICTQVVDILTCKYLPEKMIFEYAHKLLKAV